ncbi:MAG: type II toxin-antitoxin system RelE/ParE family toxin [Candidatus Woesearchaeota archaeon]
MTFEILYDKQPTKFLKTQNKDVIKRILDKIDETLKENPVPADAKYIIGEHGVYRIRIGDYRALYRINYQEKKIVVFKLDKRERIY